MDIKTTFIYALCEPETGKIRYIGKSNTPKTRLGTHLSGSSKHRSHLGHWLKLLVSRGEKPILEIIDEVPNTQWEFWEREYIRVFRALGMDLVNTTEGGEAGPVMAGDKNPMFGKPRTEEVKNKLRAYSGVNCKITGTKRSAATCERHRLVATGVPCSEEKKRKISVTLTGRTASEETRRKQSLARTGRKNTEEVKANMRVAQLLRRNKERESRGH